MTASRNTGSGQRSSVLPESPPPGTPPLPFKGYLATATLHPDRIQIDRTRMGRINGNRSTSIPWQHLVGVDFLDPTRLVNGHVHFATAADPRGLTAAGGGDPMAAAAMNPHAIMFTWQQRAAYEQLRGLLMASAAVPSAEVPSSAQGRADAAEVQPPEPRTDPVWLPGTVEVQIVGETFHITEINAATRGSPPGTRLPVVLVAEPDNPHDSNAVGVHLNGYPVGHLAREIAPAVQAALTAFSAVNGGRPPSCPAQVIWHDRTPQVVLYLDPAPLGLPASAFDWMPDSARVIRQNLAMLDRPAPDQTGLDPSGRMMLAAADEHRAQADADFDHPADAWPVAERAFRAAARQLETAGDPRISDAWVGVARSVRFQRGRRDDRITAAVTAVYWDRESRGGWNELLDASSAAPHVPTLLEVFRRVPVAVRPPVLTKLISLSRGRDRLGRMQPEAGARLRAGLDAIAEADRDKASLAKLRLDSRKHAGGAR